MLPVLAALLPVFLLILGGYVLRRTVLRAEPFWTLLQRLVYYLLFPALLVETLARADLDRVPAAGVGGALAAAILVMTGLCLALRPLLASRLRMDGPAFTSLMQGATRWQTTVALAVVASLYGDPGLAIATVAVVAMIPLLNVINVWALAHYASPGGANGWRVALAIAQNPFIWSCAIGFLLNATAPPVPPAVYEAADLLGQAAPPLGVLMVGAGLTVADLFRLRAVTLLTTALKLIVMPALALAFALAFGVGGISLAVVACCAAVPSASNAYVLARQMGGDAPLMAEILTMETVVAFVTMPLVLVMFA